MSFLLKHIQQFLAYQEFSQKKEEVSLNVIRQIRKKGLSRSFDRTYQSAQDTLEAHSYRSMQYHFHRYQLLAEHYSFTVTHKREVPASFQELNSELTAYFTVNQLRLGCIALSMQIIQKEAIDQPLLPAVLQHIEQRGEAVLPAEAVYYQCYQALSASNSLPHFQKLRHLIREFHHCFPIEELKFIYVAALNYCIRKLNAREDSFRREAFELYREGLKQDIFLENGQLSRFTYKNIVANALGLGEFDWVEDFIVSHKTQLEARYRESAYHFNLALLHYKKSNYDQAMVLLQKVGTDDVLNNLNARRMLLRIYYDQGAFDSLQSLLDSFQNYIYRKQGLGYHRSLYLNLIRYTRRLLQLNFYDREEVAQLRNTIEQTKVVAEKDWLLNKLE